MSMNWNLGPIVSYPAATADALEHHVASDLAGFLVDKGVPTERDAVLAALDEHEINPLIVSQCLERTIAIMRGAQLLGRKALDAKAVAA